MDKQKFIEKLFLKIKDLPENEIEERLNFYREMIDDRIEEGLSEEEAVAAIGDVEEIAARIIAEYNEPKSEEAKEKSVSSKRSPIMMVLLILGAPVWASLLVAAVAVVASVYAAAWAVVISLWAAAVASAGTSLGAIISGVKFLFEGKAMEAICMLGFALICAGIGILLFLLSKYTTEKLVLLTKKCVLDIKAKIAKWREKQ